jgi:uncharacterized protein (DUF433 family)
VQLPFNFAKIGMSNENLEPMTSSTDRNIPTSTIERKETGLYISGTRITIYDVLDFAIAQYPAKFIANMLNLSLEQVQIALEYIDTHRAEVEAEYRSITLEAAQLQDYWQEQNRELNERVAKLPAPVGKEAAWQKLQDQKAKRLALKT